MNEIYDAPKISIGLPVFNGEKFLSQRLNSILSQTFSNFELIISDNASTDSTPDICQDFEKKDKRIKFIRQKKNNGPQWNFNFVLQQAKSEFFVWVAADDFWETTFLEKNIKVLQKNKNFVGSISKVFMENSNQKKRTGIKNIIQKILFPIGPTDVFSITGDYNNRVRSYLKNSTCMIFYSIFRTKELKKETITTTFLGDDWAKNLAMLKLGDINIIEEELMSRSDQGVSSKDIISLSFMFNKGVIGKIFPWGPLTLWCAKNLGIRIFLRNIDYFLLLNYVGFTAQLSTLVFKRIIKSL